MLLWLAAMMLADGEPVRSVDIYVTPYYSSAGTASKREVKVGARFDPLLRSDNRADILTVRDLVLAEPARITPMTMMVLAARLYDIGERDDAVFWFYVAKDRYLTVADTLAGFDRPGMFSSGGEVAAAMSAFVQLAGPTINSYAFCDVENQQRLRRKAFDWVSANPYETIFEPRLEAKSEDRRSLLTQSLARIREGLEKETAYLTDPKNLAEIKARRAERKVDKAFCWKS